MLISSLLLSGLLAGSYHIPPASPPATRLQGHVVGAAPGDSMFLAYPGHYGPQQRRAALTGTGDFVLVLPGVTAPVPASLTCTSAHRHERQQTPLYLSPGDQLTLTVTYARFDQTLRYSGRGAAVNNYLAQSRWRFEYGPPGTGPRPPDQHTATTSVTQVRQLADAFRQARFADLHAAARRAPLTPAFQAAITAHINLQWALSLLEFPLYRAQATGAPPVLPVTYYAFLHQLPAHTLDPLPGRDRGLDDNTLVLRCLDAYGARLLGSDSLRAEPAQAARFYAQATAELGVTPARDLALFLLLRRGLERHLAAVEAAYPAFRVHNRDSTYARQLRQGLRDRQRTQPGAAAPSFALRDQTGQLITLRDLRGQVVYLDFWFASCVPCRAEMPQSLALRQRFAGQPVAFVYLDVSDPPARWQAAVDELHLGGPGSVQLHGGGAAADTLLAAYQVLEFPTHRLLGRDGHIVRWDAPPPSQTAAVTAAIQAALRQP